MRRARYRLSQFLSHRWPRALSVDELAEAEGVLGKPLVALFKRQTAGEQAHSLRVMRAVARRARVDKARAELLQAALLHDVGKSVSPLSLTDRTVVVIARWLAPAAAQRWGEGEPRGLRRPFVTARRHAEWGAELCAQTGAPPLTVDLIRRHQTRVSLPAMPKDEMLSWLQAADDDN